MIMIRKLDDADKKYCEMSVKKEGTSAWTSLDSISSLWTQFLNDAPREVFRIFPLCAMKSWNMWLQTVRKHLMTIWKVFLTQYKADPGWFCQRLGKKKHIRIFSKFHSTQIWSSKEFGHVFNFVRASWNDSDQKLKRCWEKIFWDVCKEERYFFLSLCGFNQLFLNSFSERCITWNDPNCFHSLQWNLQTNGSKPSKKHSKTIRKVF